MDIMAQAPGSRPLPPSGMVFHGGRTPGGAGRPHPARDPNLPRLPDRSDVTVGVVDTGVLLSWEGLAHPWIRSHVSICPEDDEDLLATRADGRQPALGVADGHGTFVTGLILGEAPRVLVRVHAAVDAEVVGPDGLGAAEDRLVAAAIRALAVDPRVQVINLSFGGGVFAEDHEPPELLRAALEDVDFSRVAVVASAGNEPSGEPTWPAAFPGVIGVGAVDASEVDGDGQPTLAPFSNHGSWVDAYASGVDVVGPFLDEGELRHASAADADGGRTEGFHGWATWSGTSFAAATVSGRIAASAVENDLCGAEAAAAVLAAAPPMPGQSGRLIL